MRRREEKGRRRGELITLPVLLAIAKGCYVENRSWGLMGAFTYIESGYYGDYSPLATGQLIT